MNILGSVNFKYMLASDQYIPEGTKRVIDKVGISIVESGLFVFYKRFARFISQFRTKQILSDESEKAHAVTMNQLKIPLIIYFIVVGLACIIFIVEEIVYSMKKNTKY